jgi:hypothetical protein
MNKDDDEVNTTDRKIIRLFLFNNKPLYKGQVTEKLREEYREAKTIDSTYVERRIDILYEKGFFQRENGIDSLGRLTWVFSLKNDGDTFRLLAKNLLIDPKDIVLFYKSETTKKHINTDIVKQIEQHFQIELDDELREVCYQLVTHSPRALYYGLFSQIDDTYIPSKVGHLTDDLRKEILTYHMNNMLEEFYKDYGEGEIQKLGNALTIKIRKSIRLYFNKKRAFFCSIHMHYKTEKYSRLSNDWVDTETENVSPCINCGEPAEKDKDLCISCLKEKQDKK